MKSKNDKNIRASGQQSAQYNLYTEKIVPKPYVKYKNLIKFIRMLIYGVAFGASAAVSFSLIYEYLNGNNASQNRNVRPGVVIARDEYPSDNQTASAETEPAQGTEPVTSGSEPVSVSQNIPLSGYEKLQKGIETASHTIVKVIGNQSYSENPFENEEIFSAGVIFAEIDSEYLLITQYDEINMASGVTIQFKDKSEAPGYYIKGDADTGMAIISVKENDMTVSARSYVKTATLGNSYIIEQGEAVIAAGRVMGEDFSVNIGIVTSLAHKEGLVDSYVGLINTNMMPVMQDYGFLFDAAGSLVGIPSLPFDDNTMAFYGISDLKALIEELSNGYTVTYCGIIGENVTAMMADIYNLPTGVYITSIKENSPAYEAGLQAGDVITSINDESVLTFSAFSEKIYKLKSGDKATINVKRLGRGEYRDILFSVTLGNKE